MDICKPIVRELNVPTLSEREPLACSLAHNKPIQYDYELVKPFATLHSVC